MPFDFYKYYLGIMKKYSPSEADDLEICHCTVSVFSKYIKACLITLSLQTGNVNFHSDTKGLRRIFVIGFKSNFFCHVVL